MSYAALLTDRCDIYHLDETSEPRSFGLPAARIQTYPETPDLADVHSYFRRTGSAPVLSQKEPNNKITETFLVHFLVGTDVRINDQIVWAGVAYKAKKPRNVRNHHIEVEVYRDVSL